MSTSNDATVTIATGDALDVRRFSVQQALNQLFRIELRVVSQNLDVDFDDVIGQEASFRLSTHWAGQQWTGVCLEMEQVRVERGHLATYRMVIVPRAWQLTQRKNYRIFQYESELDIVRKILGEWGIDFESRCHGPSHVVRKFRVQYGESDFAFICRMMEDAGITYNFEQTDAGTKMILDDEPQSRAISHPMLQFHERPNPNGTFVTHVAIRSKLRPGSMTIGDLDYRLRSTSQPRVSTTFGLPQEAPLEQFDYEPGAMLYKGTPDGGTPSADDRGVARTSTAEGERKAKNRLLGKRNDAKVVSFESNALDLSPGRILTVFDHPHRALASSSPLLVTSCTVEGDHDGDWRAEVESVATSVPFRPEPVTPKPHVRGLESATVVGPGGEEIHTDEYGRVRVHFHWDRESRRNETSSCWLPTNQPWAGDSFGGVNLPRIGQEVLVEFLGGDPDRPVVIGRVYTETNPVPDALPKYKRVSGLFSESSPRMVMGAAGPPGSAPATSPWGGTPLSSSQINNLVTSPGTFQAASPTGTNHQWQGSGFKIDDTSQAENLYLQANKDMHWVVRNDWITVVGNWRSAKIGTDEMISIKGDQQTKIGSNQTIQVGRRMITKVLGGRKDQVKQKFKQWADGNIKIESRGQTLALRADGVISWNADQGIHVKVENSCIKIQPNLIKIDDQDNRISINPTDAGLA